MALCPTRNYRTSILCIMSVIILTKRPDLGPVHLKITYSNFSIRLPTIALCSILNFCKMH